MNAIVTRRRFVELLGVGVGAGALVGCAAVENALAPSNVATVVDAIGNIGKVASYITAIVAAVNAGAAFVGVTIPATIEGDLTDAESIATNLAGNGTVAAVQSAVGTALTDLENVITGFAANASGELEAALNDAAQLVPEIESAAGLAVSAASPSAMRRRRLGATQPVTAVLADLRRIAALKKS